MIQKERLWCYNMSKMKDLELLFEYADELEDRLNKALAEIKAKGVYKEYMEWRNRQNEQKR